MRRGDVFLELAFTLDKEAAILKNSIHLASCRSSTRPRFSSQQGSWKAVMSYTEAIETRLTRLRATAYLTIQWFTSALEDFKPILSLISSTFNNERLMKGQYKELEERGGDLTEMERVRGKMEKERDTGLWNTSTSPLCSVNAPPHPHLLSRLLLPPSLAHAHGNTEQCLHVDPDYKPCLSLHHLTKGPDKSFMFVDKLLGKEDWRAVVKLLTGPYKKADLWKGPIVILSDSNTTALRSKYAPPRHHTLPLLPLLRPLSLSRIHSFKFSCALVLYPF
ncbi:hypothetical protein BJ165DRAFT_1408440 [Panaeolus papilionaceus]|nr:hypothetical protein BJ165DRAFT_1408440 [Panaeolus papilionaceus]